LGFTKSALSERIASTFDEIVIFFNVFCELIQRLQRSLDRIHLIQQLCVRRMRRGAGRTAATLKVHANDDDDDDDFPK
jgi:hypothetical protein